MIIDKYTLLKSLIGLIQQVNVLMNKIVTIWNPSGLPNFIRLRRIIESASLWDICSSRLRLHASCLASPANSTIAQFRFNYLVI